MNKKVYVMNDQQGTPVKCLGCRKDGFIADFDPETMIASCVTCAKPPTPDTTSSAGGSGSVML